MNLIYFRAGKKFRLYFDQRFISIWVSYCNYTLFRNLIITLFLQYLVCVSANEETTVSKYDRCILEIGCECIDLDQLTGVSCYNFTNFKLMTTKLGDGSIFDPSPPETYEVNINGIRDIPAYIIKGITVFQLILDDFGIETISDQAFDGVNRLRKFTIRSSSIREIPNFKSVTHSLRNLNLDNCLLTSVHHEIWNLTLLEELSFRNNSINEISEDAFIGLPVLHTLDLSRNRLTYLPENLLNDLKKLGMLALSYNQLYTVQGLLTIARPRFILLDHNNLTNADEILVDNMTEVETLQLNDNYFRKLSKNTFNGRVPNVRFIYLERCLIEEFNVEHFSNLSKLSLVTFASNLLQHIPSQSINFGVNNQIIFADNNISTFDAQMSTKIKRFEMPNNRLKEIGSMFQSTILAEINLNNNELTEITDFNFRDMEKTENLDLGKNLISRIDSDAFIYLRNFLQNLDLSSNSLQTLNGSIRLMSRLKSFNISHNQLQILHDGEFLGLNELANLYLENNRIITLPAELQRIPQLQYLIIKHNKITIIKKEQLPLTLRFLYYKNNSISCNCKFLLFLQWINDGKTRLKTDFSYCENNEIQSEMKSKTFQNYASCPMTCQCTCNNNNRDNSITVDCSSRNLRVVPEIFWKEESADNFEQSIYLQQNIDKRFRITDEILSLNLRNNKISTLDNWNFPKDLKILHLAENYLERLPSSVMALSFLKKISLSQNPWICDCQAVTFNKWLISKTETVFDSNETYCASNGKNIEVKNKLLINLSDVDLCPTAINLYITIAFSILVCLLLAATLIILYSHYEYNIKVWLYAHGVEWVKENDNDISKLFDAFISYSHKDDIFVVNDLVTGIEDRLPDIRLCLHYRHFPPGEFIHTNIINAVRLSKITVLVLTKNFLESDWCLLEFRAAHLQAFEDKVHKIIAIKVGELPTEMEPAIKAHLEDITYVTWGEKYFWDKFLYALPTPGKTDKRALCVISDTIKI